MRDLMIALAACVTALSSTTGASDRRQSSLDYPNQPAGFTLISERPFDARAEDGWKVWTKEGRGHFTIETDPTAPVSPDNVGQARFPAGARGGTSSGTNTGLHLATLCYHQLYISFWLKYSTNWQGHRSGVNKIFFITTPPNASNPVYLAAVGRGHGRLRAQVRLQGTPGGGRNLRPNVGHAGNLERGAWHRWEVVLRMNSGGRADGQVHWWIDGRKVGAYTDVAFVRKSRSHVWDIVKWNPTWGGRGDVVQNSQTLRLDHVYLSGAR